MLLLLAGLAGCGSSGEDGTTDSTVAKKRGAESAPKSKAAGETAKEVGWPFFGRVSRRTHYLPVPVRDLNPPLKQAWSINTHALIEFPPAISGGVAYLVNKFGNAQAIRLSDHEVLWRRTIRKRQHGNPLNVTGPAFHNGRIYLAALGGGLVALDARNGKEIWKRNLGAHLESSPMVVGNTLYIGTDSRQLLALNANNGKERWHFDAPAAIKASPSYENGRVYVADYQSSMFALNAKNGKVIWRTNTSKQPPYGGGGFYSSPGIDFGRVYAARDDGTVFAFNKNTGKVAWSYETGGQVYGSPALAKVPGTPPTVYIGSENGRFFALHAHNGEKRWSYDVGGPIPGTATVIDNTVFTSSFKTRKAIGIDVHSHKRTFSFNTAGYNPVVSNGRHLFVVGYYKLVGLKPG
ncbi:MAG TPA: PQQ-binding-like beta-propeller repeat protein [Solirubrobacterales bacterium]|nr:PQQ-binding-like beta-propeller repeat protein [Solirubrobacterales bacterium]